MTRTHKFLALPALILAVSLGSIGCLSDSHTALPSLSVDQLSALMSGPQAPVIIDANSSNVREEYGVIPGALLLTNYGSYDVATELPEDTDSNLVFYCSSTQCSAAPKAALRASAAGYTSVQVLPEGIKGWVAAGKPVDKTEPSS